MINKLYMYGAGVLLIVALGWYAHHTIYQSGVDSQAVVVGSLNKRVGELEATLKASQDAAQACSDGVESVKKESDEKMKALAAAAQMAIDDSKSSDAKTRDWQAKYNAIIKSPDCASIASMKLCKNMLGY